MTEPSKAVRILYTNHRGETAWRRIEPLYLEWDSDEWHPQEQWILHATDLDKNALRSFAMKDIKEWKQEAAKVSPGPACGP